MNSHTRTFLIVAACLNFLNFAGTQCSFASSSSIGFYDSEELTANTAPDPNTLLEQHTPADVKFGVMIGAPSEYSNNETDLFTAASLTKLFTAAVALRTLGPDYQFATEINWSRIDSDTASDLTLFGSGDPTWKNATFQEIAKRISEKGIKRILGTVTARAKDARWDEINDPAGWNPQYQRECYASLGHAFNINENCGTLSITSLHHSHWAETGLGTPVELNLRQAASTSLRVTRKGSSYVISGTFKSRATLRLPIHDTEKWIEGALKNALQAEGIEFDDRGITPSEEIRGTAESMQHLSYRLSEILKRFLKDSNCFYGDVLIQAVGAHSTNPQSDLRKGGLEEIFTMNSKSNSYASEIVLFDGSGLSILNKVSARATFAALESFKKETWFTTLWDALSIAGRDGTLATRMTGTPAQDHLRAKTGTLIGFYHLAGYVPVMDAHDQITDYLSFVFLGASTEGARRKEWIRGRENRLGAELSQKLISARSRMP